MIPKKIFVLILFAIIPTAIIWKTLDYYVFTVEIHVPIFGYIDTGVTKHQARQFVIASEEYHEVEKKLYKKYQDGKMSQDEYLRKWEKIQWEKQSDPRITAVTGGPAKEIAKFLLNKF